MKSKMKAVLMGIQLPAVESDQIESSLICPAAYGAEVRALDPRNRIALSWARAKHREGVVKLLREAIGGLPAIPGMLCSGGPSYGTGDRQPNGPFERGIKSNKGA